MKTLLLTITLIFIAAVAPTQTLTLGLLTIGTPALLVYVLNRRDI